MDKWEKLKIHLENEVSWSKENGRYLYHNFLIGMILQMKEMEEVNE